MVDPIVVKIMASEDYYQWMKLATFESPTFGNGSLLSPADELFGVKVYIDDTLPSMTYAMCYSDGSVKVNQLKFLP